MTALDELYLTVPCRVCGAPIGAACTIYRPPYGRTAHLPRQDRAVRAEQRRMYP